MLGKYHERFAGPSCHAPKILRCEGTKNRLSRTTIGGHLCKTSSEDASSLPRDGKIRRDNNRKYAGPAGGCAVIPSIDVVEGIHPEEQLIQDAEIRT